MKALSRWMLTVLPALLLVAPAWAEETPAPAPPETSQQEEPKFGRILIELSDWLSQPVGLDYLPTTKANPVNRLRTEMLDFDTGASDQGRIRLGYELKNNIGAFILTYWSHEEFGDMMLTNPGKFVYGEMAVYPMFAGAFDDGFADAVKAQATTKTRDVRVDFQREAFTTPRVSAKWFVGYRGVDHTRQFLAKYFAILPNLPPVLPPLTAQPRPDLEPLPDKAEIDSAYYGRGIEAGMDFTLPIVKKVWVETGFALAALRGDLHSYYSSKTRYYVLDYDGQLTVLEPPYTILGEYIDPLDPGKGAWADLVSQRAYGLEVTGSGTSASALVVDLYLGGRWKAWKGLEVFGGYRNTRYQNVGVDARPRAVNYSPNGALNVNELSREARSVDYEGYYLGMSYLF